ncbi:MAG TPA: 2-amino-4-hydroxy-6-hydroxymethyldihydropteridine diphosphokinase, partial [Brevundimonas sp.]|nr:2-amino-4-hydroxy-6-hydroxymethyldihydropteridine diphosphokinase [Brevundimonas sp.]
TARDLAAAAQVGRDAFPLRGA